jgi:hypothetical protein
MSFCLARSIASLPGDPINTPVDGGLGKTILFRVEEPRESSGLGETWNAWSPDWY